jgi:hypothetical protein
MKSLRFEKSESPSPFGAHAVKSKITFLCLLASSPDVAMLIRLACMMERGFWIPAGTAGQMRYSQNQ